MKFKLTKARAVAGAVEFLPKRRLAARGRSRAAQSLVEFSIVAPLFFLLMFGIIDFGRLFFTQMTLQHAMREAGRFGVTGNALPDPDAPGQMLSRIRSIQEVARRSSAGVGLDPQDIRVRTTTSASGDPDSAGGPGQTFTVSLTYSLQLITPIIGQFFSNGTHTFTVSTTFKNEPFDPSQAT
jgi:Flp pilus assembly protein TadG